MQWTFNPLVAIGIFLAFMFFGYAFGLFEGRGQGYKKRQKEESEEKKHQPVQEALPPASPPVPSDEIPILGVSMEPDGDLLLRLDGEEVDTSALSGEERKRLIGILTQMRPWLEGGQSPRTAAKPTVPPRPAAQPPRPQPAPVPEGRPAQAPTPSVAPKSPSPSSAKNEEEKPAGPRSIVQQIDEVLQTRLEGSPLDDKGIRLQESLEGGVVVWVGIQKYPTIEDVPDEQIKAAIRGAIAEWENKSTPGF